MMTRPSCRFGGAAIVLTLALQAVAHAQTNLSPASRASDGNFSAFALITEDKDWQKKWNTPTSHIPKFGTTDGLSSGEKGTLLILFSGVKPRDGRLQALCSIDIRKPDGSQQKTPEHVCYDELALGQEKNVLLANSRVEIVVEPTDAAGIYQFAVQVGDAFSPQKVKLEVGVRVDPRKGGP